MYDGTVGRPKFEISEFQLTSLLEDSFNVPDIARILGVSISTIRHRMTDFGLSVPPNVHSNFIRGFAKDHR